MKIIDVKNASIVKLENDDFLCIEINKITKTIKQCGGMNELSYKDMTRECMQVEADYKSDLAGDKPYSLGLVCCKILNGTVDRKCMKMLRAFDRVILE